MIRPKVIQRFCRYYTVGAGKSSFQDWTRQIIDVANVYNNKPWNDINAFISTLRESYISGMLAWARDEFFNNPYYVLDIEEEIVLATNWCKMIKEKADKVRNGA